MDLIAIEQELRAMRNHDPETDHARGDELLIATIRELDVDGRADTIIKIWEEKSQTWWWA